MIYRFPFCSFFLAFRPPVSAVHPHRGPKVFFVFSFAVCSTHSTEREPSQKYIIFVLQAGHTHYINVVIKVKLGNSFSLRHRFFSSFLALLPFIYDVNLFFCCAPTHLNVFATFEIWKIGNKKKGKKEAKCRARNAGKPGC